MSGSPRRAVVDLPASPDGDKVERPTGRTTLAPSGEAGSPCGARRGDPRRHLRGGPGFEAPRSSKPFNPHAFAARSGRCRPEVASRPRPGGAARLRAALILKRSIRQRDAVEPVLRRLTCDTGPPTNPPQSARGIRQMRDVAALLVGLTPTSTHGQRRPGLAPRPWRKRRRSVRGTQQGDRR